MSNPTRQEIIDAYESLDFLCVSLFNNPDTRLEKLAAAQTAIEKVLPPKPQPTMAEVEWDGDKHYMAEAEVGENKLIMLQPDLIGRIRCFDPESGKVMLAIEPEDVTPTGRRYTLTEVQE
ncbi:hypothetical protein WU87_03300 [Corynebacterium minutissimum]|uniref:Uncharacterized protein n=1 Tax=Corynebacterium minutissimum TaxID=38301 RepID=A0ACC4UCN9_9CORY|nr:hypothetical protein WU87_03300 [Corynebacterium minutissimum]